MQICLRYMYSSENVIVSCPRNKVNNRAVEFSSIALLGFIMNDGLMIRKNQCLIRYENNSRNNSSFIGCSPIQLSCNLTGRCHAVGYYSYTNRYGALKNER